MLSSDLSRVVAAASLVASCFAGAAMGAAAHEPAYAQPVAHPSPEVELQLKTRAALEAQMHATVPRASLREECRDELAVLLHDVGFAGKNLKEAWAIAMRESAGRSLGPGVEGFNGEDWGLFQFNADTWRDAPWWDEELLLDREANARLAFSLSRGGRDWILWGLDGSGNPSPELYVRAGWGPDKVARWIVQPYREYLKKFPCPRLASGA